MNRNPLVSSAEHNFDQKLQKKTRIPAISSKTAQNSAHKPKFLKSYRQSGHPVFILHEYPVHTLNFCLTEFFTR